MGTPDFAVGSLEKLVNSSHQVVAVITAPDKPAGRGRKLQHSPVKGFALQHDLKILQPTNLKDPDFVASIQELEPDLQVVVAFRMLPKVIWEIPKKGTINLHASLLPQYRGAAPINWAIINGEKESGVTTFFINENIDTGAIIEQKSVAITPDETAGTLHDKLMETGAELLKHTVDLISEGALIPQPQTSAVDLKQAPKIFKEDTLIDFELPTIRIYNFIRGLSPYPAAHTTLYSAENEWPVKIYSASIVKEDPLDKPGFIETDNRSYLHVNTMDGQIRIESLQIAGKKRMETKEFLNGFKLEKEAKFV